MSSREHEVIRERLPQLVEGEFACAERELLDSHIEGCTSCREELAMLEETMGLLRALPHPKAPPDLAAKVRTRIRRRSALFRGREQVEHRVETTSAAAVVMATLVVVGTRLLVPVPEHLDETEMDGSVIAERVATEEGYPAGGSRPEPTSVFEIRSLHFSEAGDILERAALSGGTFIDGSPIELPSTSDDLGAALWEVWVDRSALRRVLVREEGSAGTGDQGSVEAESPESLMRPRRGLEGSRGQEERILLRLWVGRELEGPRRDR